VGGFALWSGGFRCGASSFCPLPLSLLLTVSGVVEASHSHHRQCLNLLSLLVSVALQSTATLLLLPLLVPGDFKSLPAAGHFSAIAAGVGTTLD